MRAEERRGVFNYFNRDRLLDITIVLGLRNGALRMALSAQEKG